MRSRVLEWTDPSETLAAATRLSGLDYLRGLQSGEIPPPPMAAVANLEILEIERGRAVFAGTPGEEHYNPHGTVHGGWMSALVDTALGCAVHSVLDAGVIYTTLDLHVNFIRPVTRETGRLTCEGVVLHAGSRICTAEAKVRDADGRLCAHGTCTCLVMARR